MRIKALAILLFINIPLACFSQSISIDTVRYRFSYAICGTSSEESKGQYEDELSLDIGDSVTYCYSRWQDDNDKLLEKIKKKEEMRMIFLRNKDL